MKDKWKELWKEFENMNGQGEVREICQKCKYGNLDCVCNMNRETEARLKLECELHNIEVDKKRSLK